MRRTYVWDPVVRLFHWSLAAGFAANALITDPEGDLHLYIGYGVAALIAVQVEPALPERLAELVRPSYVRGAEVPARARAGHPISVPVLADHPTLGCRFEGFRLVQSGAAGRELSITPYARQPEGGAVAQVLEPYRPEALLVGLAPGRFRVRAVGRVPEDATWNDLEVLPADHLVELSVSGGIAGVQRTYTVHARGELEARVFQVRDDDGPSKCVDAFRIVHGGGGSER